MLLGPFTPALQGAGRRFLAFIEGRSVPAPWPWLLGGGSSTTLGVDEGGDESWGWVVMKEGVEVELGVEFCTCRPRLLGEDPFMEHPGMLCVEHNG